MFLLNFCSRKSEISKRDTNYSQFSFSKRDLQSFNFLINAVKNDNISKIDLILLHFSFDKVRYHRLLFLSHLIHQESMMTIF